MSRDGRDGRDGDHGQAGESAYQIAVRLGFVGTEKQWLDSLRVDVGASLTALVAKAGEQGPRGEPGPPGAPCVPVSYQFDVYRDDIGQIARVIATPL